MTDSDHFAHLDTNGMCEHLLRVARGDRAPPGARERVLSRVSALPAFAAGAAVATAGKAAWASGVAGKSAAVLAITWCAVGLGTALVGLTAVDWLQRPSRPVANAAGAASGQRGHGAQSPSEPMPTLVAVPVPVEERPTRPKPALDVVASQPQGAGPEPLASAAVPGLAPSASSFELQSTAPLTRELVALQAARAALSRGDAVNARALLGAYQREFKAGALATEAAALGVEAAFALGEAGAGALAERFLLSHPASPIAGRIRVLSESHRSEHKP